MGACPHWKLKSRNDGGIKVHVYLRIYRKIINRGDDMDNMGNSRNVTVEKKSSTLLLVLGWISAIASLVRYPFIFGVFAVIMGIVATKNGSRAGLALIMASMLLMAAGLIFSAVIFNYLKHFLGF